MQHNRKIIYLAGFLFTLPVAITTYINSSFLELQVNKNYVGLVYVISAIIATWALLKMPRMLKRLGNKKAVLLSSAMVLLSFLALAFSQSPYIIIVAFAFYFVFTGLILASLDIFMEDFSESRAIGRERGIFLLSTNAAWVIAHVISIPIIHQSSYAGIYFFGALMIALLFLVLTFFLRRFKDPVYKKADTGKTLRSFIKDRNLARIYTANFLLKFFFAWMVIYSPIYLRQYMGFSWEKIGLIFSIMLTAFVILDFPLGKLSDKFGEKKILLAGFAVIALFTLAIPFIQKPSLPIWASVLFATRLGAATIEVMSESYFFKVVREEEANKVGFFRNTFYLSYIVAPMLATPILFLIPSFKYLFSVLSAIMLIGFLTTLRLRDVR